MWGGHEERDNSWAVLGGLSHSRLCKVVVEDQGIGKSPGNHQGIIRESPGNRGIPAWIGLEAAPSPSWQGRDPSPIPG